MPRINLNLIVRKASVPLAILFLASPMTFGIGAAAAQEQQFVLRDSAPPVVTRSLPAARVGAAKSPTKPRKPLKPEIFVLSSDLLFDPSKASLTPAGEAKLKALVPTLRALGLHPMGIVGHSDRLGFESYNEELSQRQAQRLKDWFVAHGLARASAVTALGVGSRQPVAAEIVAGKDDRVGRARNRRIEITIDPNKAVEPEKIVLKAPPSPENSEAPAAEPAEDLPKELVDSGMKPATEEDLNPKFSPEGEEKSAHHNVNAAEWGTGGSNFGNNVSSFGSGTQYNAEGKRVVQITPNADKLEQQRKETVEAQNEFGLWRDR